jgi:membrane associated rhomboid family serine protease
MSGSEPTAYDAGTIPHCYRHPDRETYISCQRCGKPICPDCMNAASVGFQCPDCVREGAAASRQVRTSFGGRVTDGSSLATVVLIALNVAVFILANATGGYGSDLTRTLGLIPDASAYDPRASLEGVAQGSYWQLITSTFLHVGILHIVMNMIGLWIFGTFLETVLGRWRFIALYLLAGVAGSVCVYWLAPAGSFSLGASGSVFGLFGAALIILLKQRRNVTQLLILLGLNLALTFTVSNVSWQAHMGGLAAGLLMGAGFAYAPRTRRTAIHAGVLVGIAVVSLLLVVARTASLTA